MRIPMIPAFLMLSGLAAAQAAPSDSLPGLLRSMRTRIALDIGAGKYDSLMQWRDSARGAERDLRINGFSPFELFAIHLLAGRYGFLLDADTLSAVVSMPYRRKVVTGSDPLSANIEEDYARRLHYVRKRIAEEPSLNREDREFLGLFALHLALMADIPGEAQVKEPGPTLDEQNRAAKAFLSNHPGSRFASYVREHIHFEFEVTPWSFGLEIGGGPAGYTGELDRTLKGGGPLVFAFLWTWRGLYTELGMDLLNSDKRRDLAVEGETWPASLKSQLFRAYLGGGPILYDGPYFRFAALGQAGFAGIDVPEKPKEKNGLEANPSMDPAYGLAAVADWKTWAKRESWREGYMGFRLRYGYVWPGLDATLPELAGRYHYWALEFVMEFRGTRRVR